MGASESPPTVRPETHSPPPGPSDSRATGAPPGEDEDAHPSLHTSDSVEGPAASHPIPCTQELGPTPVPALLRRGLVLVTSPQAHPGIVQHISCLPAHPCSRDAEVPQGQGQAAQCCPSKLLS